MLGGDLSNCSVGAPTSPLCGCVGSAWRGDNATTWHLCVRPVLALFPVTSPPSHVQLVPFQLCPSGESWSWWVCYILRPCQPFSGENLAVFFCYLNPHSFLQPEETGFYLPSARPLGYVAWGWDHSSPKVSLLSLLPLLPPLPSLPHHLYTSP